MSDFNNMVMLIDLNEMVNLNVYFQALSIRMFNFRTLLSISW